jgi:hypothetical protein
MRRVSMPLYVAPNAERLVGMVTDDPEIDLEMTAKRMVMN